MEETSLFFLEVECWIISALHNDLLNLCLGYFLRASSLPSPALSMGGGVQWWAGDPTPRETDVQQVHQGCVKRHHRWNGFAQKIQATMRKYNKGHRSSPAGRVALWTWYSKMRSEDKVKQNLLILHLKVWTLWPTSYYTPCLQRLATTVLLSDTMASAFLGSTEETQCTTRWLCS